MSLVGPGQPPMGGGGGGGGGATHSAAGYLVWVGVQKKQPKKSLIKNEFILFMQ